MLLWHEAVIWFVGFLLRRGAENEVADDDHMNGQYLRITSADGALLLF